VRTPILAVITALAASCSTPAVAPSTAPSASPAASATAAITTAPSPTAQLTLAARRIDGVGGRAQVSPDGKLIAAPEAPPAGKVPYTPAALVYDLDGKLVRRIEAPGGSWRWIPDSSGLFVALDAPQRSPSLGIVDLATGTVRDTGLQMAGASLSRDGKWILAVHQVGCCVAIEQREIWIAPRAGGSARLFLRSKTERQQPIGILGIDAQDRLVYRDHDEILRVPIAGGTPQSLGTLASAMVLSNEKGFTDGDTSPDGMAMLVRTYDPVRWHIVANDQVTPWVDNIGSIVEDRQGLRLQFYAAAMWTGPHSLLVRASTGELSSFDAITGLPTALRASIEASDLALAYGGGRLLVARGKTAVAIDTATGRQGDIGVELGSDLEGSRAIALPSGGLILSTGTATYRID
jgi:hypothetical protein